MSSDRRFVGFGMHTLNWDLARLVNLGKILREDALKLTTNRKHLLELL